MWHGQPFWALYVPIMHQYSCNWIMLKSLCYGKKFCCIVHLSFMTECLDWWFMRNCWALSVHYLGNLFHVFCTLYDLWWVIFCWCVSLQWRVVWNDLFVRRQQKESKSDVVCLRTRSVIYLLPIKAVVEIHIAHLPDFCGKDFVFRWCKKSCFSWLHITFSV